jgi:hypothetical protein
MDMGLVTTYDPNPDMAYGTTYYWKVVAYNGNGDAVGAPVWSFTIMPDPSITTLPHTQNFDGTWIGTPAAPAGWTVINANSDGYTWRQANTWITPTHSEPYAAHGMGNTNDWLITPPITLTADTRLKWWDKVESASYVNTYTVKVSTTTPDVASFTTDLGTYNCANTAWLERTINLDAYTGSTIYLAFHQTASGSTNYGFGIDDFLLEEIPEVAIFAYTPSSIAYPLTAENATTAYTNVVVSNNGGGTLNLAAGDISLIGANADQFGFTTVDFPAALTAGQSVNIPVRFQPTSVGAKTATLRISYDGMDYDVALSGYAYGATNLYESFEATGFPPAGWTNPGFWSRSTTFSAEGVASAYIWTSTTEAILSTPLLTMDANSSVVFQARTGSTNADQRIQVKYSSDRTTWTSIGDPIALASNAPFATFSVDLSSLAGNNYYIGFAAYTAVTGGSIYMDQVVTPTVTPLTPDPVALVSPADAAVAQIEMPTLSWTSAATGGVPTGFKVYCDTNNPPATLITTAAASPYTFTTALNYNTLYYWSIVATNATGDAVGSPVRSFTTRTDPTVTPPWSVDFGTVAGDWPVLNWSQMAGLYGTTPVAGTQWFQDDFANVTTPLNKSAKINIYGTTRYGWLVTPPIAIPAAGYELKFDIALTDWNGTVSPVAGEQADDKFIVFIDDNPNMSSPTILREWNNTGSPYVFDSISNTGENHIINLDAYTGTVYFAFYGESSVSNGDNDFFVDNVIVRQTPAGAPDAVTLATPAEEAIMPKNGFNLTWTPAITGGTADYYGVYMSMDDENIYGDIYFETTATSLNPTTFAEGPSTPIAFNYGERWFWTVEAVNGGGTAVVDPPRMFEIESDPAITSFPYVQNFDALTNPAMPTGWTIIGSNAGTDNREWRTGSNVGANSLPNAAVVYYHSTLPKNEWMITPPASLEAGVGYNVRFQLKAPGYGGVPEKLAVYAGTEATIVNLTANAALWSDENLLQATFTEIVIPYTPATTGNYYFGWHAYSVADVDYIAVDDIKIELQPTTPVFELTPNTTWAFGEVQLANPGVKTFQIKNAGSSTLNVSSADISITDDAEGDFTLTANDLPVVLAANETYTFTVTFTPSTVGDKTANLNVMDTYLSVNNVVALTGTAIPEPIGNVVNLQAAVQSNVNVALTWGIAYGTPGTPGWLNWDSGVNTNGIGTGAAADFQVAAKFTSGDLFNYEDMEITTIKFFPRSATATYTLKIWTGNDIDLAPVTEVYSEVVAAPTINAWNEIVLATPYLVTGDDAVYFGYQVVETGTGHPAGCDAGPAVPGKGNLIYWNSVWQELTNLNAALNYNWNVQAYANTAAVRDLTLLKNRTPRPVAVYNAPFTRDALRNNLSTDPNSPVTATRVLRGYNIFRDNVQINPTLVAVTNYLDMNLAPDTYSYAVQAVFYSQNSPLSAPAEVTVTYVPPIALPFTEDWATNLFTTNNWTPGAANWANYSQTGNPAPSVRFTWNPQVTDYDIPLTSFDFAGTGINRIKLKFDLALDNFSIDAENMMSIDVWDGTIWNTIETFSSFDNDGAGWGYTTMFYEISTHAANREFKIRFRAHGEDSYEINYWYLDNIVIEELITPATAPVVTIATSTTVGSVTLSWDAVANADWYGIYAGDTPDDLTYIGYALVSPVDIVAESKKFFQVRAGAGTLPAIGRLESSTAIRNNK